MNDVKADQARGQPTQLEPGVHGWLLVFVLWLGVIAPVFWISFNFIILERMEDVNPADAEFMRASGWGVLLWIVTIIREGMRLVAALILYFHRKPISVWIALATLWMSGPLLILVTWLVVGGSEFNLPGLVRSALWAVIWTLFLFMSHRVSLTYNFRPKT